MFPFGRCFSQLSMKVRFSFYLAAWRENISEEGRELKVHRIEFPRLWRNQTESNWIVGATLFVSPGVKFVSNIDNSSSIFFCPIRFRHVHVNRPFISRDRVSLFFSLFLFLFFFFFCFSFDIFTRRHGKQPLVRYRLAIGTRVNLAQNRAILKINSCWLFPQFVPGCTSVVVLAVARGTGQTRWEFRESRGRETKRNNERTKRGEKDRNSSSLFYTARLD